MPYQYSRVIEQPAPVSECSGGVNNNLLQGKPKYNGGSNNSQMSMQHLSQHRGSNASKFPTVFVSNEDEEVTLRN